VADAERRAQSVSQKVIMNSHTRSLVWRNIGIQKITTTNWANKIKTTDTFPPSSNISTPFSSIIS